MLQKVPDFQQSPDIIRPVEPTLADVLATIEQDASLRKATRDGWCCSIRRVAEFLERDPAHLPARLGALRYGTARLHHARLGISRKTLQNHVANLKAAVRHFAGLKRLSGRGVPLTLAWKALVDRTRNGAYVSAFRASSGIARPAASIPLPSPTRPSKPSSRTLARSSSPLSPVTSTSRSPAAGIALSGRFPAGPRRRRIADRTSPSCPAGPHLASIATSTTTAHRSGTRRRPAGSGSAEMAGRSTTARSTAWFADGRTWPLVSPSTHTCSGPAWQPALPFTSERTWAWR